LISRGPALSCGCDTPLFDEGSKAALQCPAGQVNARGVVDPVQGGAVRTRGNGSKNGPEFLLGDLLGHGFGIGANWTLRAILALYMARFNNRAT
jgi:hypothetical protein